MADPMRADAGADATGRKRREDPRSGAIVGGAFLILVGGYFLVRQALPAVDLGFWWPLVSVGVGVILVVLAIRPRGSAGSSGT